MCFADLGVALGHPGEKYVYDRELCHVLAHLMTLRSSSHTTRVLEEYYTNLIVFSVL